MEAPIVDWAEDMEDAWLERYDDQDPYDPDYKHPDGSPCIDM
jgi:hypothetical protein